MKQRPVIGGVLAAALMLNFFAGTAFAGAAGGGAENPFARADGQREEQLSVMTGRYGAKAGRAASSAEEPVSGAGGCIVKFNDTAPHEEIASLLADYQYELIGNSALRLFSIKGASRERLEAAFFGKYVYIEDDRSSEALTACDDPLLGEQWALNAVNITGAWDIDAGSSDVTVAVIDTGVYRTHEDLADSSLLAGRDYVYGGTVTKDVIGHGTETTGVIAAAVNNGVGIAGTCKSVTVLPLQVFSASTQSADTSDICQALYDAADAGADVINLSLGSTDSDRTEREAIAYAVQKGCIIVAAAGNDYTSVYEYPASYEGVISAASVNSDLKRSAFSNYNNAVDVAAPGEYVLTTCDPGFVGYAYAYVNGTSFSSPYVAGIAALAKSLDSGIDTYQFLELLKVTCKDLGSAGYDNYYGYGLIDAEAILSLVQESGEAGFAVENGVLKGYFGAGGDITIPDTVTRIGDNAFAGCAALTSVTIADTVTTIGLKSFSGCPSLKSVVIPSSVKTIGESAFKDCPQLKSITMDNGVTNIGWNAFYGTGYYDTGGNWDGGVLYIGKNLIAANWLHLGNTYKVKESTESIADSAFYGCENLTAVTLPNSLKSVGSAAFGYCRKLQSVVIPESVTYIGELAFASCTALTEAFIPADTASFSSNLFKGTSKLAAVTVGNFVSGGQGGCTENTAGYSASDLFEFSKLSAAFVTDVYFLNPYGQITGGMPKNSVRIHGYAGSTAEKYASDNGYPFVSLLKTVSVTVKTPPAKTAYFAGDTLNTDGLSLTVAFEDDSVQTVTGGFVCSPTTLTTAGTQVITITYNGMTAAFPVTVTAVALSGITVKINPIKENYTVGDTLDTAGLALTAAYNNGKTETVISGFTCSPMTLTAVGTQVITVAYQGKTTTFTVKVAPVLVAGVKLNAASAAITLGGTKQLTAAVSPANATNTAVTWTSGNTSAATVSPSGLVTAKAVGKATITCKAKDDSGKSASCAVIVMPNAPASPKAASASYNSNKIAWTAVSGATGYVVYCADSKTGAYTKIGVTASTSLTHKSLSTGKMYYYKIRAYKTVNGENIYSAYTAVVSAKPVPAVPASFKAASASYNSIKVTWTAVSGATGYAVYYATSKTGAYTKVGVTASTSLTHKSLSTGKAYYYKVRAYKTVNGENIYGADTAVVSAKPVPAVPASFTAVKAGSTSVKLTWKAVTGASGYEVWMATSQNGTYSKITSTTKTTYTKTKLTKNKTYYFKARSYRTVNGAKVYGSFTVIKSAKPS